MAEVTDDKSPLCIPFIVKHVEEHRRRHGDRPFFVGLNGVQGAGKTTLVTALESTLSSPPYSLPIVTLSIDDLYHTRETQSALTKAHPSNPLLQQRGPPGTHDLQLGHSVLASLSKRESNIAIPFYDKSAYNGLGDRASRDTWRVVNKADNNRIGVVVVEGWSVGFRALSEDEVQKRWTAAHDQEVNGQSVGQLGKMKLEDVLFINQELKAYDKVTDFFDVFIHIDAEDTHYVYDWRLQQEAALRKAKGSGMTDQQVKQFVDNYYPAYELFSDNLRSGIFAEKGKQLRLVVDKHRRVQSSFVI